MENDGIQNTIYSIMQIFIQIRFPNNVVNRFL